MQQYIVWSRFWMGRSWRTDDGKEWIEDMQTCPSLDAADDRIEELASGWGNLIVDFVVLPVGERPDVLPVPPVEYDLGGES